MKVKNLWFHDLSPFTIPQILRCPHHCARQYFCIFARPSLLAYFPMGNPEGGELTFPHCPECRAGCPKRHRAGISGIVWKPEEGHPPTGTFSLFQFPSHLASTSACSRLSWGLGHLKPYSWPRRRLLSSWGLGKTHGGWQRSLLCFETSLRQ